MDNPSIIAPAPWKLTGEGLVWLYAFPREFNLEHGFLEDFQASAYLGKIGAVMYLNYRTTNVGPYQELLFLPGLFKVNGQVAFSVSKIYVSTSASAWNGRENWGIPKEIADFSFLKSSDGLMDLELSAGNQVFFTAQAKSFGPRLPVTTRPLPLVKLVQNVREQLLLTKPEMDGQGQLASSKSISADPRFFPPIQQLKPLATIGITDFRMVFPVPEVLPGNLRQDQ
ncbi:acetoacetate decarboxylase family protein [Sabulibacter ruber]|uniref:acetoacetate decarboxylase family protein n=1 Tax=Sabulibacter ruber TaxID=2811901 RepID=UPI001A96C309|nr:acetoacetate decarboxylase family protein [Sabulibacter ruber]